MAACTRAGRHKDKRRERASPEPNARSGQGALGPQTARSAAARMQLDHTLLTLSEHTRRNSSHTPQRPVNHEKPATGSLTREPSPPPPGRKHVRAEAWLAHHRAFQLLALVHTAGPEATSSVKARQRNTAQRIHATPPRSHAADARARHSLTRGGHQYHCHSGLLTQRSPSEHAQLRPARIVDQRPQSGLQHNLHATRTPLSLERHACEVHRQVGSQARDRQPLVSRVRVRRIVRHLRLGQAPRGARQQRARYGLQLQRDQPTGRTLHQSRARCANHPACSPRYAGAAAGAEREVVLLLVRVGPVGRPPTGVHLLGVGEHLSVSVGREGHPPHLCVRSVTHRPPPH
jgi:hypothetical protein